MSGGFLVREVGVSDVASAMTVMQAAFDPAWGEAWSERQLADFVIGPGSVLLLAAPERDAAEPASGFALIRVMAGEAELMLLGVVPELQRRGVASELLGASADAARMHGAEVIFLEVRASNDGARQLYQQTGFRMIGRRVGYYRGADGVPHDAITYSKPLS